MLNSFYNRHRFSIHWIGLALLIKSILFVFFAWNFKANWPANLIHYSFFIESGDTSGYYLPVEQFVDGFGYGSFCRMPGLLPIYGPLYFFFGEHWGKLFVILLQVLAGSLSVFLLAKTALLLFNNMKAFYLSFFLYALSSFVSIWDHYGLSDSFSTSFLVFSGFFLVKFLKTGKRNTLLLSGLFIAWSIAFRPIGLLAMPCYLFLLALSSGNLYSKIRSLVVLVLPLCAGLSAWTLYNHRLHNRIVVLQGPITECYGKAYTEDLLSIRMLIITIGGDYQPWSKGSEAEWFFSGVETSPFDESDFAPAYTLDTLIALKKDYALLHHSDLPDMQKDSLETHIVKSCERYISSYKNEKPLHFFLLNRIELLRKFVFFSRLDDLPFPKRSEMNSLQVLAKGGYLLLLNLVSFLGLLGILLSSFKKEFFGIVPLAFVLIIGGVLGFVEQRYLVPAYPFLCLYSALCFSRLTDVFRKSKA